MWASVPLLGYNFFDALSRYANVTLVTHGRNQEAIETVRDGRTVSYIYDSNKITNYYKLLSRFVFSWLESWPVRHALSYPVYAEFNRKVYRKFHEDVLNGTYDVVHALTPILPRFPVKIITACNHTPFVIGPVNGGIPFPGQFKEVAYRESAHLNFLRGFSRLLPGYARTYKRADKILTGSTYTFQMVKKRFSLPDSKLELFFENGVTSEFFRPGYMRTLSPESIRLLFVGRLTAYKGADILLTAISRLDDDIKKRVRLTIVGDGPEKRNLQRLAVELGIGEAIQFTGWINQIDTIEHYRRADIFCFPSIREFGGAVVLEAMASGLPCIVTDYGGIAEYVSGDAGFKIPPKSRHYMVEAFAKKIHLLATDKSLYGSLSQAAISRAAEFEWGKKVKGLMDIYSGLVSR